MASVAPRTTFGYVGTTLVFDHESLDAETNAFVEMIATAVQSGLDGLISSQGMGSPSTVTLVLADDFVGAVQRHSPVDMSDYTTSRIGGQVVAKNLVPVPNTDEAVIVVDALSFDLTAPDHDQIMGAFVLAHELVHPPLTWT